MNEYLADIGDTVELVEIRGGKTHLGLAGFAVAACGRYPRFPDPGRQRARMGAVITTSGSPDLVTCLPCRRYLETA